MCSQGTLHPHRALFVIRFARDGVEGTLRDFVHVGFEEVKGHEDLPRCGNFRETKFHAACTPSTRNDVDGIMAPQAQPLGVSRINFQPCLRREAFEDRNLAGLGASVPVLHRAARIEHEGIVAARLFREGRPVCADQFGAAIRGMKFGVGIEARVLLTRRSELV